MTAVTGTTEWAVRVHGSGRPLVLLHGFTGTGAAWEAHVDAFAARRVLVPDLPGHGGTPAATPADASIEHMADVLAGMLTALEAAPADVVGYSLGARVALRLAAVHPSAVARLVLESPSAGIEADDARADRRRADEALAGRIEREGIDAFVGEWERNPVFHTHAALPAERRDRIRAMRRSNTAPGLATSLRGAGQGAMEPLFDRLALVTAPTLVLAGALDDTGRPRAERVASGIPGARLAIVDGAGHTPHDEQPDAFRHLVLDFLEEDPTA